MALSSGNGKKPRKFNWLLKDIFADSDVKNLVCLSKIMTLLQCSTEGKKANTNIKVLTLYLGFTVKNNWQQYFQGFVDSNSHQNKPEIIYFSHMQHPCESPPHALLLNSSFRAQHQDWERCLLGCVGKNGSTQWGKSVVID